MLSSSSDKTPIEKLKEYYGINISDGQIAQHLLNYINYMVNEHRLGRDYAIIRFNGYCTDRNINASIKTSIYSGDLEFNLADINVENLHNALREERKYLENIFNCGHPIEKLKEYYGINISNDQIAQHLLNYINYMVNEHEQGKDDAINRFNVYCTDRNINASIQTVGSDLEFNLSDINVENLCSAFREERKYLENILNHIPNTEVRQPITRQVEELLSPRER